jgi:hypothetical protein
LIVPRQNWGKSCALSICWKTTRRGLFKMRLRLRAAKRTLTGSMTRLKAKMRTLTARGIFWKRQIIRFWSFKTQLMTFKTSWSTRPIQTNLRTFRSLSRRSSLSLTTLHVEELSP